MNMYLSSLFDLYLYFSFCYRSDTYLSPPWGSLYSTTRAWIWNSVFIAMHIWYIFDFVFWKQNFSGGEFFFKIWIIFECDTYLIHIWPHVCEVFKKNWDEFSVWVVKFEFWILLSMWYISDTYLASPLHVTAGFLRHHQPWVWIKVSIPDDDRTHGVW